MDTQSQYNHTNSKGVTYHLNSKEVTLRGGRVQRLKVKLYYIETQRLENFYGQYLKKKMTNLSVIVVHQ